MAGCPAESLDFIINHVILPPKLPQEADDSNVSHAAKQHLLRLLSSEADFYRLQIQQHTNGNASAIIEAWAVIQTMLLRCATVVSAQYLSTELLVRLFSELKIEGMSRHKVLNFCCLARSSNQHRCSSGTDQCSECRAHCAEE